MKENDSEVTLSSVVEELSNFALDVYNRHKYLSEKFNNPEYFSEELQKGCQALLITSEKLKQKAKDNLNKKN